jgi:hypothetical protein
MTPAQSRERWDGPDASVIRQQELHEMTADDELEQYFQVSEQGRRLPDAALMQGPAFLAFQLGKIESAVNLLEVKILRLHAAILCALPYIETPRVRATLQNALEETGGKRS